MKTKVDELTTLREWFDSISIKYKNFELKNSIIAYHYYTHYKKKLTLADYLDIKAPLRYIKWIAMTFLSLIYKKNSGSIIMSSSVNKIKNKLGDYNIYVINPSPADSRNFLHIFPLSENDPSSVVMTLREDVYRLLYNLNKPVIYFKINSFLRFDYIIKGSKKKKKVDFISKTMISQAINLIDLLDEFNAKYGLPKKIITLQDINSDDSIFAMYYLGKIPTITLQHGTIGLSNPLWSFTLSDFIITWGDRQAQLLKLFGVESERIKVLGTAKYDYYLKKMVDFNFKTTESKKLYKRVLIGIQQLKSYSYQESKVIEFILGLLTKFNYSELSLKIAIRFHPAIENKFKRKFIKLFNNLKLKKSYLIEISQISDPLEDIMLSDIILTHKTTLANEAFLLKRPVIEYLSKKDSANNYLDYRDYVLHAEAASDAIILIEKLLNFHEFYRNIVEEQSNCGVSDIIPPPSIQRILKFINILQ